MNHDSDGARTPDNAVEPDIQNNEDSTPPSLDIGTFNRLSSIPVDSSTLLQQVGLQLR